MRRPRPPRDGPNQTHTQGGASAPTTHPNLSRPYSLNEQLHPFMLHEVAGEDEDGYVEQKEKRDGEC